jgi:uncharacterized protein (TIGR03437 family)
MQTTASPCDGGSKRYCAAALRTRLIASFLLAAASCGAQIPGSITVTDLPQYAYGASAMDAAGNLYIGTGGESTYPVTPGAAQTQFGGAACTVGGALIARPKVGTGPPPGTGVQSCTDAYLTKVNSAGNTVYATFLGRSGNDFASAVTVDSAGNLYAAGTAGGSFPTTANAAIATSNTSTTFAAKLNKTGSAFLYVTYLPATLAKVSAIAVDGQGNAYISGTTTTNHAIVIAVNADGSSFPYTTTLAGSQQESGGALMVDSSGDVIVTGRTDSRDFPVTAGVVQPNYGGAFDEFVTKLDPAGNVVFSTYLGGSGQEFGAVLGTDAAGNIYVTGATASTDFPTTSHSLQSTPAVPIWNNAYPGGYLTSITPDGSRLNYSTYIPSWDQSGGPYAIAVGTGGDVYLLDAGLAGSPVSTSAPQPCYNGGNDVFLAHFGPQGQLEDSTFVGDPHVSLPSNNYLPVDGAVMLLSTTGGTGNMPAFEQVRFGEPGWSAPACITPVVLNGATLNSQSQVVAAGEVVSLVGNGIGPATGVAYQGLPVPRMLGGVQVFFDGIQAPLLYAQSNQVNAIVPVEMNGQPSASVTLQYQNATFGPFTQQISAFDPAIFRWNPGTSSQAAAINQDGTINGPANPAPAGSIIAVWGTGLGPLATPCSDGDPNIDAADYLAASYSTVINSSGNISVPYSGGAPLLLCGVMQMNMQIPAGTPSGNFAIYPTAEYRSGNTYVYAQASAGATVVVK